MKLTEDEEQLLTRIVLTRAMLGKCEGGQPSFLVPGQTLWSWFRFRSENEVHDYQQKLSQALKQCPRVAQALKHEHWHIHWKKEKYYLQRRWFAPPPLRTHCGVAYSEKKLDFIDEFGEIEGCDYDHAVVLLQRRFSGAVLPNELVDLLTEFQEHPCVETALDLILFDGAFIAFFFQNAPLDDTIT